MAMTGHLGGGDFVAASLRQRAPQGTQHELEADDQGGAEQRDLEPIAIQTRMNTMTATPYRSTTERFSRTVFSIVARSGARPAAPAAPALRHPLPNRHARRSSLT